jgi:hypothetical protein
MNIVLMSVSDFAVFLGKSPQRVYQLIHDGLLEEVGISVYRTRKGRVWLRTTTAAYSETDSPARKKERRLTELESSAPSVCGRA